MKYYNKDYANFIIDDETEKRIELERPKKYSWYQYGEYNVAYNKSQLWHTKYGIKIAFFFAVMSICYLILSIYGYYSGGRDMGVFIPQLLIGLCWGLYSILYYYIAKKARTAELKKQSKHCRIKRQLRFFTLSYILSFFHIYGVLNVRFIIYEHHYLGILQG